MPLPLTILGGYLGAGKTTLVNHLLRNADGLRLAVLVNEFGELPIDQDLIETQDDDVISIAGGCVCCSYGNDMTLALIELAKLDPAPDHVLLESSGVAIPGAISGAISLLDAYRTDGIIVLADAETLRQNAADAYMGDTVLRQLADADLILLNKCDLVSGTERQAIRTWIAERETGTSIVETRHSTIDPAVVLDSFLARRRAPGPAHHATPVQSVTLRPAAPLDVAVLAATLASQDLGLVRAKGFVTCQDGQSHLIQVVGRRWSTTAVNTIPHPGIVCLGLAPQTNWDAVRSLEDKHDQPA